MNVYNLLAIVLVFILFIKMMFSGKVVLITGSSSGIGAGAAIYLTKLGASVTITGLNLEKLNKVAKQCEEISKKQPLVVLGDLTHEGFIKTLLDKTIQHYKKLDVLINNAGIYIHGGLLDTSIEQYEKLLNINLHAVFILTKLAVPYLIETKGNVVNISSVAGIRSFPGGLAYCMSKSALDQFTRCVSLELASKGVRVNSINPGPVYTDIAINAGATEEQAKEFWERFGENVPLKRVGTVDEIARSIAFLASDESASYITGVCLPVDAGQMNMSGTFPE